MNLEPFAKLLSAYMVLGACTSTLLVLCACQLGWIRVEKKHLRLILFILMAQISVLVIGLMMKEFTLNTQAIEREIRTADKRKLADLFTELDRVRITQIENEKTISKLNEEVAIARQRPLTEEEIAEMKVHQGIRGWVYSKWTIVGATNVCGDEYQKLDEPRGMFAYEGNFDLAPIGKKRWTSACDQNGQFWFPLPPGRYTIFVGSYRAKEVTVKLGQWENTELRIDEVREIYP
ncbi:MAG: carboxypeptidase regulatory-like domain-containing protein [Planctomycetes bacterium]|nr:carboxypeptidase regulatory-like domain-containing protein [Planctomycetota bacterium]